MASNVAAKLDFTIDVVQPHQRKLPLPPLLPLAASSNGNHPNLGTTENYSDKEHNHAALSLSSSTSSQLSWMPNQLASLLDAVSNSSSAAIVAYCGSSILMTTTNKYVLSGYEFNLNFFLLMVQSIVCISAIRILKALGWIYFKDFNMVEAKKWFPISTLLVIMIYTSSKALQFLSIPVYTIFKNLTIILIAYGEVLWFGGAVSRLALFSFSLMVLSSLVAAWADIHVAISSQTSTAAWLNLGYIWMAVNCVSTAAYVLSMRIRIKATGFKDFDTMFYNNFLTIPILLASSIMVEDWSSENVSRNFPPQVRARLTVAMIVSGLLTILIAYSSAWCVRVTTSTTYSMVGALNKLPIAISGLIFFDAPVTVFSVTAIVIGFLAGLVYAGSQVQEKKKKNLVNCQLPIGRNARIS
ncbi:UDP-galactose transporter [Lipomyces japonicus]|uniref:UDP-galactose transporter n=1 Tax=Lipomyces japonicus TaxID=56871 RepID=UPI0034CF3AC1